MRPHESLHRLDIQDVGYEAPIERPNVLFDPQHDVLPTDVAAIRQLFDRQRADDDWRDVELIMVLQKYDPSFELEKEINDQNIRGMKKQLKEYKNDKFWSEYANLAIFLGTFDPAFSIDREVSPKDIKSLRQDMQRIKANHLWKDYSKMAIALHRLQPTFDANKELPAGDYENILAELRRLRAAGKWQEFAEIACDLHELFPQHNIATEITAFEYKSLQNALEHLRHVSVQMQWWYFAQMAITLDRLSKIVTVADAPSQSTAMQPMPITKKY